MLSPSPPPEDEVGTATVTLDPAAITDLAARAGIDPETTSRLLAFVPRVSANPDLVDTTARLLSRLVNAPPKEAIADVAACGVERALGADTGLYYLLLALLEIPSATRRHAAQGVEERITTATFRDLSIWCRHFREKFGDLGVTLEILDWAQTYLRGDLYRLGALQFELRGFTGPLFAFRHRSTGEVRSLAEPGAVFCNGGRSIAPSAAGSGELLTATGSMEGSTPTGHLIARSGAVSEEVVSLDLVDFEQVLCPGAPMLEMHIPADARVTIATFKDSLSQAFPFFSRLSAKNPPRGIFGEAWLLDPQIPALVPRLSGIAAIQSICALYPARIPEAKTIRRLFGPQATRKMVIDLPRQGMNLLQRAIADFLSSPENVLCSAGGFLLADAVAAFGVPVGAAG